MHIVEAVLTEDGELKVPDEIQRTLGVKPADKVRFVVDGNTVRLESAQSSLLAGFGSVRPTNRPEDFEAIRRDIEAEIGRSVADEARPR